MLFQRQREIAKTAIAIGEELAELAGAEVRIGIDKRIEVLPLFAAGALAGLLGLVFAGAAALVLAYDTAYRVHVAVGLPLFLLIFAAALFGAGFSKWKQRPPMLEATSEEIKETYRWLKTQM